MTSLNKKAKAPKAAVRTQMPECHSFNASAYKDNNNFSNPNNMNKIISFLARFIVFALPLHPIRWSSPINRVVYRGNNNANANGGVSYANANNDASNANANNGSRLEINQRKTIGVQHRGRVPTWCRGEQATATAVERLES